jgi:hypothetical protein
VSVIGVGIRQEMRVHLVPMAPRKAFSVQAERGGKPLT